MYIRRLGQSQEIAASALAGDLTANFDVREFASRGTPVPPHYHTNVRRLAQNLQVIRDHLRRPIKVSSGYRTAEHNRSVGGAVNSQHLTATGADIQIRGMTPSQVYCAIEELIRQGRVEQGGLGIYRGHVHYDVRGHRARWTGKGVSSPGCPSISKSTSSRQSVTVASGDEKFFKKHKKGGYYRYGGGLVHKLLKDLRESGKLSINDADIDMFQRIANVESAGQIQGINSYDSAFMSMGFMQWPIAYGKLQRLIERAPNAFRKYGIELDAPRRYTIRTKYRPETPIAIKGAHNPDALRSFDWAKRFYAAGLDPDVIVEEVKLALEVIEQSKKRLEKKVGKSFLPYYERSPILRALIQETFNNRPKYMCLALKRAIARNKVRGNTNDVQFLELVREAIREIYKEKEPLKGPKKAENIIYKTSRLKL